jgi:hypothetical protein
LVVLKLLQKVKEECQSFQKVASLDLGVDYLLPVCDLYGYVVEFGNGGVKTLFRKL